MFNYDIDTRIQKKSLDLLLAISPLFYPMCACMYIYTRYIYIFVTELVRIFLAYAYKGISRTHNIFFNFKEHA